MSFLKIPKVIAEQIGELPYAPGKSVSLIAGRTKLGTHYLIDEETIDTIKANSEAILNFLPPNLRGRMNMIINMNKSDHQKLTQEEAMQEREEPKLPGT